MRNKVEVVVIVGFESVDIEVFLMKVVVLINLLDYLLGLDIFNIFELDISGLGQLDNWYLGDFLWEILRPGW